jgi:hypothetical protein
MFLELLRKPGGGTRGETWVSQDQTKKGILKVFFMLKRIGSYGEFKTGKGLEVSAFLKDLEDISRNMEVNKIKIQCFLSSQPCREERSVK